MTEQPPPNDRTLPDDGPDEAHQPIEELPHKGDQLPEVVQHVDEGQIKQFVTTLRTAEQQIGEHVIRALSDQDTVAVLTTVIVGPDGQQRIVSAALDPELLQQVQQLLSEAQEHRQEEVPCVGFHCYVKPKKNDADQAGKNEG